MMLASSIDVDRAAEEVFAYATLTLFVRHGEVHRSPTNAATLTRTRT